MAHQGWKCEFFESLDATGIKFYDSLYVELNVRFFNELGNEYFVRLFFGIGSRRVVLRTANIDS